MFLNFWLFYKDGEHMSATDEIKEPVVLKPCAKGFIKKYIACFVPAVVMIPIYFFASSIPYGRYATMIWPLIGVAVVLWVLRSREAGVSVFLTIMFVIVYGAHRIYKLLEETGWNYVEASSKFYLGVIDEIFSVAVFATVPIGFLVLTFVELYRRSITYTITENGVHFRGGIIKRVTRDMSFHMIGQVILEQSFLGRLLNYGTLILVSPAAWGEEYYVRGVGVGGGRGVGAGVGYARVLQEISRDPLKVMYAIPNPEIVAELIEKNVSIPFQHYKKGLEFFTKHT